MKIGTDENGIVLTEVYSGVSLKTRDGEFMGICMRDSGFEFTYEGKNYRANEGVIEEIKIKIPTYKKGEIAVTPHAQ